MDISLNVTAHSSESDGEDFILIEGILKIFLLKSGYILMFCTVRLRIATDGKCKSVSGGDIPLNCCEVRAML